MTAYPQKQKVYIKSHNTTQKIMNRYTISLIIFTILTVIINLILKNTSEVIELVKSLIISLVITSLLSYIINIIKKEYNFLKIYTEGDTITISLIIGLFGTNTNIIVISIAILLSLIIKNVFKNINQSSVLYGIIIIAIYKYYLNNFISPLNIVASSDYSMTLSQIIAIKTNITNYLFGIEYLSPILSIIVLIYLFHHKSIKYPLIFSYTITIFIIMFIYGLLSNFNFWFAIFELATGNLLFLVVYTLTDYKATPTTSEGNIIYGIVLGIITSILRFIIPELAAPMAIILGNILLLKPIENISPKLKYDKKLYNTVYITSVFLIIITAILLKIV